MLERDFDYERRHTVRCGPFDSYVATLTACAPGETFAEPVPGSEEETYYDDHDATEVPF